MKWLRQRTSGQTCSNEHKYWGGKTIKNELKCGLGNQYFDKGTDNVLETTH